MSKLKKLNLIFVFGLVAWALSLNSQFSGLIVLVCLVLLAIALKRWIVSLEPAKLRQSGIEKQGFYIEVDSPGLYRGADLHDFGVSYYEFDGKISFEGTWPPKNRAVLEVPSPDEWKIKMPDWVKSRRAIVLERITKANCFIDFEPSIDCSKE